jgi:hypothetical protein
LGASKGRNVFTQSTQCFYAKIPQRGKPVKRIRDLDWKICENLREKSAKICGEIFFGHQESDSSREFLEVNQIFMSHDFALKGSR